MPEEADENQKEGKQLDQTERRKKNDNPPQQLGRVSLPPADETLGRLFHESDTAFPGFGVLQETKPR
jgi:hypothetical protein